MQFLYMFIKQKLYQIIENYRRNIILISLGGGGGGGLFKDIDCKLTYFLV